MSPKRDSTLADLEQSNVDLRRELAELHRRLDERTQRGSSPCPLNWVVSGRSNTGTRDRSSRKTTSQDYRKKERSWTGATARSPVRMVRLMDVA